MGDPRATSGGAASRTWLPESPVTDDVLRTPDLSGPEVNLQRFVGGSRAGTIGEAARGFGRFRRSTVLEVDQLVLNSPPRTFHYPSVLTAITLLRSHSDS